MPTNAMGREAANPGGPSAGGRSNADRDRDAARALSGAFGSRGTGGMSPGLLDNKYPGARRKKSKSAALTLGNVGTLLGKISDITNPAVAATKMGIEAISGADLPTFDDAFEGMGPDVPSVGAGYADSGKKADTVTGLTASRKKKSARPTNPLGSIGTILSMAGGSIRAGGL
jgi:hypothetical protein